MSSDSDEAPASPPSKRIKTNEPSTVSYRTPVCYVHSPQHLAACSTLPIHSKRVSTQNHWHLFHIDKAIMIHELIEAYGLLSYMRVVFPVKATEEELEAFHSAKHVKLLKKCDKKCQENGGSLDIHSKLAKNAAKHGIKDECYAFAG